MLNAEDIKDLVNGGEGYNVDFNGMYPRKFANLQKKFVVF